MRKSRLNLFKSTSMLISIVGIISIIFLIVLVGFSGYSIVNKSITDQISSGNQYDDLAQLKTKYSNLESQFDSVKSTFYSGGSDDVQKYNDARLELSRAQSAIDNVQSGLDANKPSNEIDSRITFANQKLADAQHAFDNL